MKIRHYLIAATISLMFSTAHAATFVVSNVIDGTSETLYANGPTTASGLRSGGVATIGYFTAGYVITGNPSLDLPQYTVISSALIGGPSADLGGSFAGYAQSDQLSLGTITTGNQLLNRPLYSLMNYAGTLADPKLGASLASMILIQVGTIGNDVPFEQAYSSNPALNNPVAGYGQVGSFTGNAAGLGSATYRTLYPVPEPSAALLGALGALGLLRRRRA